jgi:uncharacterized protein
MHNDIFRINQWKLNLPLAPSGMRWSDELWGTISGDWLALYRPLNLALVYIKIRKSGDKIIPEGDIDWLKLRKDKYIFNSTENWDEIDIDNLRKQADKGGFRFLCILPTTNCAFDCAYCHQKPPNGKGETLKKSDLLRALDKSRELCAETPPPLDILIYGGEPLLAFSVVKELIHQVCDLNLFGKEARLTLTTSGLGITQAIAEYLAYHKVFVIISLDGSVEINDEVRRSKRQLRAYDIAEKAGDLLRGQGCRLGLSTTIGKHNADNLKQKVEFLLKRFEPKDIGLNAFLHRINSEKNPYQVDSKTAFRAVISGLKIAQQCGVYAEQPFRRLKPFSQRKPLLKDCSAPGERLVIVPGGLLGFCDSCYPERKYFYKIDDFPKLKSAEYRRWSYLSSVNIPACRECPAMTICGGACRFDAYEASGSLEGTDTERCQFELRFLNWMIWETFKTKPISTTAFFHPSLRDRESIWRNIEMTSENQPFTAGSYAPGGALV